MKADDLKLLALRWLRARYPDAHLLREFSVSDGGSALVDVAAICPDQIIGVEVKGDGDSKSRLGLQAQMYPRVCRKVFLLPAPSLLAKMTDAKPPEWGLIQPPGSVPRQYSSWTVCQASGLVWYANRGGWASRAAGWGLSVMTLSTLVWSPEGKRFRDLLGVPKKDWPTTKDARARLIADRFPLTQVETAVCTILRERQWLGGKVVILPEQEIA